MTPHADNGLETISQIMIDKMMAIKRGRVAKVIGRADIQNLRDVERALRTWLQIDKGDLQQA